MSWASRRQFQYILGVLIFLFAAGFLILYPKLHQAPSCFNNKQDGLETGVDCGGSCSRTCSVEVDPIALLWARSFEVVPGHYNAVAYLENKNVNNAVNEIHYRFRFSDANNVYIGQRDGTTYIPPFGKFAVFEPAIDTGSSVPIYTTFEFTEEPVWVKVNPQKVKQLRMSVSAINLSGEDTAPHLSATVTNDSLFTIPAVHVVAVLYNQAGEALAASSTYIEHFSGNTSQDVDFTWPKTFDEPVVTKELLPIYNIFDVKVE